jgi:hypothetical protein
MRQPDSAVLTASAARPGARNKWPAPFPATSFLFFNNGKSDAEGRSLVSVRSVPLSVVHPKNPMLSDDRLLFPSTGRSAESVKSAESG